MLTLESGGPTLGTRPMPMLRQTEGWASCRPALSEELQKLTLVLLLLLLRAVMFPQGS